MEAALSSELDSRCTTTGPSGGPRRARARLMARVATWLAQRCRTSIELPASEIPLAALVHELARLESEASETPADEHAGLAARWAGAWGLSGDVVAALAAHHAAQRDSEPTGGAALIALAEHVTAAVCRGDLDQADRALSPGLAAGLGLRAVDMALVIGLAASELAAMAA